MSWSSGECFTALRQAVKLWGRTFSRLWDFLLASMVWRWIGHVLRLPDNTLVRHVLLSLRPFARVHGDQRRHRTGPDNSGHRSVLRYLQHQKIPLTTAQNRNEWFDKETAWIRHLGISVVAAHMNVFAAPTNQHLWEVLCLQGSFTGQQVFVCAVRAAPAAMTILELDRSLRWRAFPGRGVSNTGSLLQDIWESGWIRQTTFHLRILLFQLNDAADDLEVFMNVLPLSFEPLHRSKVVVEISFLPYEWRSRIKRLTMELAC